MSYFGEYNLGVETLRMCEEFKIGAPGKWRNHLQTDELVAEFRVSGEGKMSLTYGYDSFLYSKDELKKIHADIYRSDDYSRNMQKIRAVVEATLNNDGMEFTA